MADPGNSELYIYNTLTRKKEKFEPLNPPYVGLYVCGPTVYGDAHLGHSRPSLTFDLLFRYLKHLGYKVRYVRNITDVGHMESNADEGEDKILKKARLAKLEPMEVVQYYTNRFRHNMWSLNVLEPSIEPLASGHIIEQQEFVDLIVKSGYGYEVNGSVYFDVDKYNRNFNYGKLSGRVIEDLISNTRELEGQEEKKNPYDFALWKKASPEHLMHWPSRWGEGFPGWHLECSTMSTKYLGEEFDIHGGGMDLLFPHHECEIAQSTAALGKESVKYWMHNNLVTINGQKMGKSLGNAISLFEFFSGDHPLLDKAYHPMAIRFFIMQAHYRSTVDFSNDAIQASEKGLQRLFEGIKTLDKLKSSEHSTVDVEALERKCYDAMNDDLNSPVLISHLFDGLKIINFINAGQDFINEKDLKNLKNLYHDFLYNILGIDKPEEKIDTENLSDRIIRKFLQVRKEAKQRKDFATADLIRETLNQLGIEIKDTKDGFEWKIKT
ncbi:MAG: cysteine--tRNA ligase [Bacteroidales bacterium]|nr:MAG: cysteine--tRNA ligase [Bacteroidales bacterium]